MVAPFFSIGPSLLLASRSTRSDTRTFTRELIPARPKRRWPRLRASPMKLWSSALVPGARDPRTPLSGFEAGLKGLWRFNEGRGTITVDSVSWRSGGISRFATLTPAIAPPPTEPRPIDPIASPPATPGLDQGGWGATLAAWSVSRAPEGGLARSLEGRPVFLRLNGTDAHLRRLTAVLTRAPAAGNLSIAAPVGEWTGRGDGGLALGVGDSVPIGVRLMYRPEARSLDRWLEDRSPLEDEGSSSEGSAWTDEAVPYDWVLYRVEAEGGELSVNEATVELSVSLGIDGPHVVWASKVCRRVLQIPGTVIRFDGGSAPVISSAK